MGKPSVKGWRRLVIAAAMTGILAIPTPSYATWPVLDELGLTAALETKAEIMKEIKLFTDQIKILTDSLNFLKDIKGVITDVSNAIGDLTTISLPITSLPSLKRQAIANWKCLTSFDKLAPGIVFEDIDFGSLCGARAAVRASMFTDPSQMKDKPLSEQNVMRREVRNRRVAVHADATSEGLAAAIAAQSQTFEDMTRAFSELQAAAEAARTVTEHLAVGNKIALASYQAQIDQYSLQATALRLAAAQSLRDVPTSVDLSGTDEEEGN
jgi:hypothetical protein